MWLLWIAGAWAALLDLNQAGVSELDRLPGIGRARAEAIVAHREANGPFTGIDGLLGVSGIGPGTVENLRGLVRCGPVVLATSRQRPSAQEARLPLVPSAVSVDPNTATLVELAALPGISGPRAEAIVADREANGPFERCDDLLRVPGIGPATLASLRGSCAVAGLPDPEIP